MMKRDLQQLTNRNFDLLVIGAGIYGSFIAWDAALRGLSVALIDKGDFGNATSANSLKIIHGGLRYLQDFNLPLTLSMVNERKTWMRIAPHLVHPLPFLMPTTRGITRSKTALKIALRINDIIGYNRNHHQEPQKWVPDSRIISKREFLVKVPGFDSQDITGGAMWYDAQMYSSERLLISVVLSAVQKGAVAANYVRATGFLKKGNKIIGVKASDELTNQDFHIRTKFVVNATGPWVGALVENLQDSEPRLKFNPSIAINLVTRKVLDGFALGVPSQHSITMENGEKVRRSRVLFIVPWQGYSILGTRHAAYTGTPESFKVDECMIDDFLAEINMAYPAARLSRDDIYHIHYGFLPKVREDQSIHSVRLLRESVVYDHEESDGISGLISVIGVKYTTARITAEKAINIIFNKLGLEPSNCRTQETPLYGGYIDRFSDFVTQAVSKRPHRIDPKVVERLVYNYGSEYNLILDYLHEDPNLGQTITDTSAIIKAEIIHAVRVEMAQSLADVILRRTDLGAAGPPNSDCLYTCAEILTGELGWDQAKRDQEIEELLALYPLNLWGKEKEEIVI